MVPLYIYRLVRNNLLATGTNVSMILGLYWSLYTPERRDPGPARTKPYYHTGA